MGEKKLLKPYSVVRVLKVVGQADDYDGWKVNQRPPAVGDVGILLDVLTASGLAEKYVVESSGADGTTVWLAEFLAEELEVVEDSPARQLESTPEDLATTEAQRHCDWQSLYAALGAALAEFGREDAYGKGDYWIVDDDYGDTAHKVCVPHIAFVTADLVHAVQRTLLELPHWRVLIQIDEEVLGVPASSSGVTIHCDKVLADPRLQVAL